MPCCLQEVSALLTEGVIKQGHMTSGAFLARRSPLAHRHARHILTRQCTMMCFSEVSRGPDSCGLSGNQLVLRVVSGLCYWPTGCFSFKASLAPSKIVTFHLPQRPLCRGRETLYRQVLAEWETVPPVKRVKKGFLNGGTSDISEQTILLCRRATLCAVGQHPWPLSTRCQLHATPASQLWQPEMCPDIT